MKIFTKADIVIIALVLCIALAGYVVGSFVLGDRSELVIIEVEGKLHSKYDFGIENTVPIETTYGRNTIQITKTGVRVSSSDCSDRLDVLQGEITKPGQTIVCLPHKLVIYITGKADYDIISH